MTPSTPFGEALAAGRGRYNTLFALARMGGARLDPGTFLDHLRETVGPIVDAVHRHDPERATPVLDVLYDVSLDLFGRGWMGPQARFPMMDRAWRQAFVALAPHLAEEPRRLVTAVMNALYHLSREPGADPGTWLNDIVRVGALATNVDTLLDAGSVLAWRCGMAHYRAGALATCAKLPPALTTAALGLGALPDDALPPLLTALTDDPWLHPARTAETDGGARLRFVRACGGFRGFGGPFLTPPHVAVQDGTLIAWDAVAQWILHADVFGAVFHRIGDAADAPTANPSDVLYIDEHGTVRSIDQGEIFPGLSGSSSAAAVGATLAVTLPHAHYVYLIALTADRAYAHT